MIHILTICAVYAHDINQFDTTCWICKEVKT
jgi:hypothetical protein